MNSFFLFLYLTIPPVPGSFCTDQNPDFDGYRYQESIPHCKRHVTTSRKIAVCRRDGVEDRSEFTVDHIIPLSIGGSNADDNLWCQHKSLAVTGLEYKAFQALSKSEATQKEAVDMVLSVKFKTE